MKNTMTYLIFVVMVSFCLMYPPVSAGQEHAFLSWPLPGVSFKFPKSVAVDESENVYVVDNLNHRIQKFTSEGVFLRTWGEQGAGAGQFQNPRGVAVGPSGDVYVVDSYNHRIQKFNSEGLFLTKLGTYGTGDGQFRSPTDVAVDSSGNIYVSDAASNCIQKFSSDGVFLKK